MTLRKFVKRAIPFLTVCMLIVVLVAPSLVTTGKAYDEDPTGNRMFMYAIIPFDRVRAARSSMTFVSAWVENTIFYDTSDYDNPFVFVDGKNAGYEITSGTRFGRLMSTEFSFGTLRGLTLTFYCDEVVIPKEWFSKYQSKFTAGVDSDVKFDAALSYELCLMDDSGREYSVKAVSQGGSKSGVYSFDLLDALGDSISLCPDYEYLYFRDIELTLSNFDDELAEQFHLNLDMSLNDPSSVSEWFNSLTVPLTVSDGSQPDLFGWLIKPIQAFFNLQITPGITLGGIAGIMIAAMVVIAVLMFFKGK